MDKLLYFIRKELIFHLEFYGTYPHARVGWVWIIIAFFFFHMQLIGTSNHLTFKAYEFGPDIYCR